MTRPKPSEYPTFYQTYLDALPKRGQPRTLLKQTFRETHRILAALTEAQANFAYEPGKWTIKEMVLHMIDTERVFAYRTLSFMRGDRAPLPGFNQDQWMEDIRVQDRSMASLLKEWKAVRDNTLFLLEQCTDEQAQFVGVASNWRVSVRAYFYIIPGHHLHHLSVLRSRYLPHFS